MENKYYIPDISEFYVGFEFEYNDSDLIEEFQKIKFNWAWADIVYDDYEHLTKDDLEDVYRVKYLDSEDLENLGFIKENKFNICIVGDEEDEDLEWDLFYKKVTYGFLSCHVNYTDKVVTIHKDRMDKESATESIILYRGILKNKSELIKILKNVTYKWPNLS